MLMLITKYKLYNESLKSLLVGPTKEEVFKSLGYDRTFDTPEDFFLYMIDGMKIKEKTDKIILWEKNGTIIFEQNFRYKNLYVDYNSIWVILNKVFGLEFLEIQSFIKNMVEENLNWIGFTAHGRIISL